MSFPFNQSFLTQWTNSRRVIQIHSKITICQILRCSIIYHHRQKSWRLTICNRGFQNVSLSKSLAANLGVEADKPVVRYSKGSYNTKSWATADLPFDITGTFTLLRYSWTNSVGDVKCPLLRSFPFKHWEFHNDEVFMTYQILSYCSFEHLRFQKDNKSNFHSFHVELRNAAGHLVPFFLIGQVQLNLLFKKKSWSILPFILIKTVG